MTGSDFDFIDDDAGGKFVAVGGPLGQLRQLLARGDIDAAVSLYEESAGAARTGLIEEADVASFDTKKSIATMFKRARDFNAAARVYELARLDMDAAANYEQAGDFMSAGLAFKRGGELLRAAACLERGGKANEAIELYRKAGSNEALAECFARQKRFEEAAALFRALGNAHAEVEVLRSAIEARQGGTNLPRRLAELMVQYGHPQRAVQLLMETARAMPKGKEDLALLTELAQMLELTGNTGAAEKVRQKLAQLVNASEPTQSHTPAPPPVLTPAPSAPRNAGPDGYGFLKALPMFAELTLSDMKALYRICSEATFQPGQNVIQIGLPGAGLFVIVDGMVEVFGGPDASSRLLNTMGAGAYVGEISLIRDEPTSARVTARTAVKALFISRNAFSDYLYNNTSAALCIFRLFTFNLAERVRALSAAK